MIPREALTGVILCGGEAVRLGGIEKGLLPLAGTPMFAHVRARLAPQVGPIIISANRDVSAYAQFGDTVVPDRTPGLGPLGGLAAALALVHTPYTFCCPGDAPFLAPSLVMRLATALLAEDADVAMPRDAERVQQLFLLFPTARRDTLTTYLEDGGRSVLGWTDRLRTAVLAVPDLPPAFLNVNTPEAVATAAEQLHGTPIHAPPHSEFP